MRKRLYTPGETPTFVPPPLRPIIESQQPDAWAAPPPPPLPPTKGWGAMPWTSRFLVIAAGFFLVAGLAASLIFFLGARSVSSERVDIVPQGPVSIGSGDTVSLLITVKNKNPIVISNTNLLVDLPEGTRQAGDLTVPFDHYTDTLGDIAPGAEASRTVTMVLFGAQNEALTIPIRVEYRTEDSNALFVAEETYTVTVTSSPLGLTVSSVAEAASGEPFATVVTVRSNAPAPLDNVGVRIDYPFGFTQSNTSPKPDRGSLFAIGKLLPGEQKTITIQGALTGSDADERVFRVTAGTMREGDSELSLTYASADALVKVTRPFLATSLTLNRESGETVLVPPGESVSGMLTWQNNLTVPVTDAQVTVKFSGNGFDPAGVYTQSGFYRSNDSTILFSKDTNRELAQLLPGDSGSGSFSFVPKSAAQLAGVANPTVTLTVSIAGNRTGQDRVQEAVSSTITRTVKVGTSVGFSSRALRSIGPFKNTGPIPPRPDQETTYTVELTASNGVNSVGGASASMVLPAYVRFTGQVSPTDGTVTYDERTRTVVWRVNDLNAGASKKAYFQIAFLPSASQSGTSPVLVPEQTFTATDRFTKQQVSAQAGRFTTQTTEDPNYQSSHGQVAK